MNTSTKRTVTKYFVCPNCNTRVRTEGLCVKCADSEAQAEQRAQSMRDKERDITGAYHWSYWD